MKRALTALQRDERERLDDAVLSAANQNSASTEGTPTTIIAPHGEGDKPHVDVVVAAIAHADVLERNVYAALSLGLLNDLGVDARTMVHRSMAHVLDSSPRKVRNLLISFSVASMTNASFRFPASFFPPSFLLSFSSPPTTRPISMESMLSLWTNIAA